MVPAERVITNASSRTDMLDAMLDLAKQAVRAAVEAGGDPAAGVLRLLLNEMSPMPEPREPQSIAADADMHLRAVMAAKVLADLAKARRSAAGAGQLNAIATLCRDVAKLTKGD